MKINLRKAKALQEAINEALMALDLKTEVQINEFERPSDKVEEEKARFNKNLNLRAALNAAYYDIRRNVAAANAHGISNILADVALIDRDISLYARLAKLPPALERGVIVGKLGKIKGRESEYGYHDDVVVTSIFTKEEIEEFKATLASLKKAKVTNQDVLLEMNVTTEVTLLDSTVATLKEVGII